ncbi:MAG: sulfatase-like hydrolase/transferase [Algibacter sp.]|uniref:sulfatase-like hydrolase/transferase n=1 Tax=Algibacter sp. TaxID=1872428 RepID=UPI002619F26E|nr:sulfatase-like hydrolase/transferase [Algibacter sp.]MDG1730697.1 sulfatase-like hydrolase/transferase [Algibacter sp.]MDG2177648.1 sulfatase-like hydrolase/transferase [Algibacter sp.]
MIKFYVLFSLVVTLCSCGKNKSNENLAAITIQANKPNIIVVIVDDAGYVDFGFMGSEDLETPHIDNLAKDGVIFTDAHVSATVCAPSRAGLITGKYQQRFGFEANGTGYGSSGDIGLSDDVLTMADVFKKNDYKTIAIGKWHLGATPSDHPNQRGFDEFYGFLAGSRSYFPIHNPSKNHMLQQNGKQVKFDGYLTDVLGNRSVRFVEENKDRPFFMYLAYNAVHTPMEAKESDLIKYKNHPRQDLAAMTWSLDENIGKLRNKLKELGILENTLIYFISDNGGAHNNSSKMGPLKGWKGNKFEGGHRVPFIVSWPSKITGNQIFNGLSSSLDIFSTSVAAAGIEKEKDLILDGTNLLPYLSGEKQGDPHHKLFWRKLDEAAARVGSHKLIRLKNYGSTMYNLSNDLGEVNNLSEKDTITFNLLTQNLSIWESNMTTPLWDEEKSWMDVTYHIHEQLMANKPALYKEPSSKEGLLSH